MLNIKIEKEGECFYLYKKVLFWWSKVPSAIVDHGHKKFAIYGDDSLGDATKSADYFEKYGVPILDTTVADLKRDIRRLKYG